MKLVFSLKDREHGGDSPIKFCWQTVLGNFLATTGHDNNVKVWDRHGQLIEEMPLPGNCTGLAWDVAGDVLCAISDKSSTLFLWDSTQKKSLKIDSGAKDGHNFLAWSKKDFFLAIGTAKGNLILYNHKLGRKVPILGKHSKKITCGSWSTIQNCLGLGSDDKTVTISDTSGKTLHQFNVTDSPSMLQFSDMKGSSKTQSVENTVSLVLGKKTLFLYKLSDPDGPSQLAFSPKYGKIESYCWYGDNYMMLGFSHGHLVAISTHPNEIGREIFHVRNHHEYLSSVAVSQSLSLAATCGDASVHIHDLRKLEEVSAIITVGEGAREVGWSDDGQLLVVTTNTSALHCYLTKLPMLADTYATRIAYLTSLLEVTVCSPVMDDDDDVVKVGIDVEPSFLACGPYHLAVGMNNRAWFYLLSHQQQGKEGGRDREYLATIEHMSLNDEYAAVMFDGKLQLHMIEEGMELSEDGREAKMFPTREDDGRITCSTLTNHFLIYATEKGSLCYFYVEEWAEVNVYRHHVGIRQIYPNDCGGSHTAFIDVNGDGVVYNPVDDSVHRIPDLPAKVAGLLWETNPFDKDVFIVYDDEDIYTYIFHRESLEGGEVVLAGKSRLPYSQRPLLLNNGTLTLQVASGKINSLLLDTHNFLAHIHDSGDKPQVDVKKMLHDAISLRRWKEAWQACVSINQSACWQQLGEAALSSLDVELAIRVYRQLQDAGMVLSLEKVRHVEDRNLLAGTLASYMGRFDRAQELLLASSNPGAALDLRRDLMQWDTALQLASRLDPNQIPFIAKEYGQQLEFTGNYSAAHTHFEKGLLRLPEHREHDEACAAGLARTSLRLGNIRRGVDIAIKHPSMQLKKDCGAILENMRQFAESAALYERSAYYDKAAAVYIRAKNWSKVGELLPKVSNLKIHVQYAKAKEADKRYEEAADAYHHAKEYDSEIRISLDHLRDPERAVKIVKATGSTDGAKMVANFFIKLGDYGSAIQFLVLSRCNDEAFHMAKKHGQMEVYVEIVGDEATPEDLMSIALYFENEHNHLMAGKFFSRSGKYAKALNHFLRCQLTDEDSDEILELAVEAVAAANDPHLTRQLSNYLLGEHDGVPKEANYLFKMYMALGQYGEAAHTAIIISRESQSKGQFKRAHDLLFGMMVELRRRHIKIPAEMESNMMILHSYMLAKLQIKRANHPVAARLLVRVAENISKFPTNIVSILTSCVIECHKSQMKQSSFSYAAMLMRPEYRNQIDVKYRKKIEHIVRKTGGKAEDEDENSSPCPYCDFDLTDSELLCASCRSNIPYCIVTGRHISKGDVCRCPLCEFPAIYSEFQALLSHEPTCPMCNGTVSPDDLVRIKNISQLLTPTH